MDKKFIKKVADAIEKDSFKGVTFDMTDWLGKDRDGNMLADIAGYALLCHETVSFKIFKECKVSSKLPNYNWYGLDGKRIDAAGEVEKLFDIHGDLVTELSDPEGYELCKKKNSEITRSDAVEVLRHLIKTEEVDWSIIDDD